MASQAPAGLAESLPGIVCFRKAWPGHSQPGPQRTDGLRGFLEVLWETFERCPGVGK